jgi:hypothetical protein
MRSTFLQKTLKKTNDKLTSSYAKLKPWNSFFFRLIRFFFYDVVFAFDVQKSEFVDPFLLLQDVRHLRINDKIFKLGPLNCILRHRHKPHFGEKYMKNWFWQIRNCITKCKMYICCYKSYIWGRWYIWLVCVAGLFYTNHYSDPRHAAAPHTLSSPTTAHYYRYNPHDVIGPAAYTTAISSCSPPPLSYSHVTTCLESKTIWAALFQNRTLLEFPEHLIPTLSKHPTCCQKEQQMDRR